MSSLPNLVVAGAMKCGTTSLHEYLARHPSVQMSTPKEVNFFAGGNAHRSLDWYKSLFDPSFPVRGESSQNYTKRHHPWFSGAIDRMAGVIPEARIIYLVRDPIERYKSHVFYNYFNELNRDRGLWSGEENSYFKTGLFAFQLDAVFAHYPEDRVLVVDSDDLKTDRARTMNRIFTFLGVDVLPDDGRFAFTVNEHSDVRIPARTRRNPFVRFAMKVAPMSVESILTSDPVQTYFRQRSGAMTIPDGAEDRLRAAYAEDVARLRALTGQSFSKWSF